MRRFSEKISRRRSSGCKQPYMNYWEDFQKVVCHFLKRNRVPSSWWELAPISKELTLAASFFSGDPQLGEME